MRKAVIVLATLLAGTAHSDAWLAVTLYPGGTVYQVSHLRTLRQVTQSLWEIEDRKGSAPLSAMDALATTNAIAIQGTDVRFRRLIEDRELNARGMERLAELIERHPLLGRRLVTDNTEGTHFWFRLKQGYSPQQKAQLLRAYSRRLGQAFGKECNITTNPDQGPLTGVLRTEWRWHADQPDNPVQALEALRQARPEGTSVLMSYSAADVLAYLRQTLGQDPGLPETPEEIAQLYTVAESLRSRHLKDLARPDFRELRLVVLSREKPDTVRMPGYELKSEKHWRATPDTYRVVDCR